MKTKTIFILFLTAILTLAAGSAFGVYSGGSGTASDPYQIADVNDLLELAADINDYNKCFILTANIDLTGLTFNQAPIAPDTDNTPWNGFQGMQFTGVFDGNGNVISNLTITTHVSDYIGLFGYVGSSGKIRNLGVENVNITGREGVGGLVGENDGMLTDCYATGSVSGDDAGGLVGANAGTLTDCYATGSTSASGTGGAGGLVEHNYGPGTVTDCYATGSVTGGYYVGGLVGANDGMLTDCYATGSVSGAGSGQFSFSGVGGLVGANDGMLTDCYATGSVTGNYHVDGLAGHNGGILTACFWDTNTTGKTVGVGDGTSTGVTGKTTTQMQTLSTFISAGWDFVDAWGIGNAQTYPYLKPLTGFNPADLNYDGTVDFADFAIFAANWLAGE